MLVVVDSHDALLDWNLRYVENLRKIGKEIERLFHGKGIHTFFLFFYLKS